MSAPVEPAPVDVLVPVRNGAPLIGQVCAALALQSAPPRRVLFLDDGSRDGTAEAVEAARARDAAAPAEIVLLRASEGIGVAAARNRLLEAAAEGPVAWFDADDLWSEDSLERRLRAWTALDAEARARTVLYGDYSLHPGGRLGSGRLVRTPDRVTLPLLAAIDATPRTIQLQTAFGAREAFQLGGGFDAELPRSEDVEFMFRHLAAGGELARIPGPPLAFYFQSFRGREAAAIERAHDAILARWGSALEAAGADLTLWRLDKRLRYTLFAHLAGGDRDAVRAILREAWRRRRHPVVRAALKARIAGLKGGATGAPSRPLEARRTREEATRSLRLKEGEDGLSIRFAAEAPLKIVLEWRDAEGRAVAIRRIEGAARASVPTRELLSAWLGGAVDLRIKGVAREGSSDRTVRIARSTEGALTLR